MQSWVSNSDCQNWLSRVFAYWAISLVPGVEFSDFMVMANFLKIISMINIASGKGKDYGTVSSLWVLNSTLCWFRPQYTSDSESREHEFWKNTNRTLYLYESSPSIKDFKTILGTLYAVKWWILTFALFHEDRVLYFYKCDLILTNQREKIKIKTSRYV